MSEGFDRATLNRSRLKLRSAHDGVGQIEFCRLVNATEVDSSLNFVDYAVLPAGTSIGLHRHAADEEEFYLVLRGSGEMHRNGERFRVRSGDLIRTPPAGEHSLVNDEKHPLHLFVFEISVS